MEKRKERPILFSTPMVQALLEGKKTQTRRIVKPQPEDCTGRHSLFEGVPWAKEPTKFVESFSNQGYWYCEYCGNGTGESNQFKGIKCPYGQVGDILWVRETIYQVGKHIQSHPEDDEWKTWSGRPIFNYAADGEPIVKENNDWHQEIGTIGKKNFTAYSGDLYWRKLSSIFMPRAACRIRLEITDIRVERLGEISEEDAIAEGVFHCVDGFIQDRYKDYMADASGYGHPDVDFPTVSTAKASFQSLWESIKGSYDPQIWVWAITFKPLP